MYKFSAVLNTVLPPATIYIRSGDKIIVKTSVCGVVWCFFNYMQIFIFLCRSLDVAKRQSKPLPDPKDRGIGRIHTRDGLSV